MSITLIVAKSGSSSGGSGDRIALADWLELVKQDRELRLRTEPVNVKMNNVTVAVDPLPGQTEFAVGKDHVLFLGFRSGKLVMPYSPALEDATNPVRHKVAYVARRLGAIIKHDSGDEILAW